MAWRNAYKLQDNQEQNRSSERYRKNVRRRNIDVLPKKEVIQLKKEWDKLEKNLGGIKDMKTLPDAILS